MSFEEMCVGLNYMNLHQFLQAFRLSVELFEFLERGGGPPSVGVFGGVFIQYRMVAARDGALNIYHFGSALEALRKQVAAHEVFDGKIDRLKLRVARKQFRADFPHISSVRHAIAHAGELFDTPQKVAKHPGLASGAGGVLQTTFRDRTYSIDFEGNLFAVQLDATSISKLEHIYMLVTEAFSVAAVPNAPPGS